MRDLLLRLAVLCSVALLVGCAATPPAQTPAAPPPPVPPPAVKMDSEATVRKTLAGSNLALFHRAPLQSETRSKEVVLLLPPNGMPTAAAFDVKDYSLMAFLAARGYDAWSMDYRGFGRSGWPPGSESAPALRLENALADVKAVIDAVLTSTGTRDLTLVGYGYGGLVAAMAAERYPEKVSRLVLYNTAFAFKLGKPGAMLRKSPLESKPGVLNTHLPTTEEIDWETSTLKE